MTFRRGQEAAAETFAVDVITSHFTDDEIQAQMVVALFFFSVNVTET